MIEKLYKLYHQDVYYYIFSLCKNLTLCEDMVSETFYQLMLSLPSFKGHSDIKTFIFGIARNVTYKELRKRKEEIPLDLLIETASIEKDTHLMNEIEELMKQQSKVSQQVFWLKYQGYTYDEIARKLKMNPSSVRVINHRNMLYLRENLERGNES